MTSLGSTDDYFSDLKVLLSNCEREVLDQVDKEMLQELKDKRSTLDSHGTRLKDAANELDWSSDEQREEYIDEMDEALETLDRGLSRIDVDEGVDQNVAQEMRDAARLLSENTVGLMEDL